MKHIRKALTLLLTALLVFSLCACGSNTTNSTSNSNKEETSQQTEAAAETVENAAGDSEKEPADDSNSDSNEKEAASVSIAESGDQTETSDESASARQEQPGNPPDGNGAPDGNGGPGGTPPDGNGAPDGNGGPGGTPPDGNGAPDGMPPGGEGGNGSSNHGGPGGAPGGSSSSDIEYSGAVEITSEDSQSDQTYDSSTVDESALLISTSDDVTVSNPTVSKSGDSDGGDNCNFYGLNAAVLVKDGSVTTITGGTITSDASGANGVFCYGGNGGQNGAEGDGTTVYISDTTITTTGDGSGGIMTTGGGVTHAENLTVTTSGRSSAAIRTDRGGGTVYVDGGTYTSNGLGSPAIYSTAEIHVANATLTSNLSEGVCIEGLNSIELTDCDLTADNTECNGNATFLDSIMIYQSMSGDAASGTSSFTMTGGSLTSKSGHVFHVTNTSAVITLSGVAITNEDSENILLSVCDDGWSGGSNEAALNASAQELTGAILVGSNSTLHLNLTDGSAFEGYIDGAITNAGGTVVSTETGTVSVTLDDSSTWTLTGDSYVTEFNGDAANVISNGYTLYVNGTALTGTGNN
ncbi:MAG: hypothetical protein Q4D81_10105 [Eubacteriales bacterium]|nr:hypothetical protein [Eubacteriales bacterium]